MSHLTPDDLNLYLDGMLDAGARAGAEAHLAACAACRAELATLRDLFLALDTLQPEAMPVDLSAVVLARAVLAIQIVLVGALALWLGPLFINWWQLGLASLPGVLPAAPDMAELAWSTPSTDMLSAALRRIGNAFDMLNTSLSAGLMPWQWALVIAAAAVVWLIGNRLLLAGHIEPRSTQEAAQ